MKGGTVEINWHETKPVLSVDFHPQSSTLATAGADHDIKLWLVSSSSPSPSPSFLYSLVHHSSTVNVVRFSPSGHQLASGADGGELVIWNLHLSPPTSTWKLFKTLAFHRKDVLDLSWSPDGAFIVSGSVDNSCLIWDAIKGSVHQILDSHFHYVQGVTWDPLHKYVASLSSDRSCRIYVNKPQGKPNSPDKLNFVCHHVLTKAELPSDSAEPESKPGKSHLFHDETLPTFFRRLSWSPDGSFLLIPAGCYKTSPAAEAINTAYVFSRTDLSRPALQLPCANKPVIAVRFCPLRFTLRGSSPSGFFKLPYRLIFAVATLNSLFVYDTESISPIAVWAGLHYAAITDIAWSFDARYLALSSQDGYCTLVEFENDELGSPILLEPNDRPCVDGSYPDHESASMEIEVTPNSGATENMSMEIEANNATEKQASPVSASSRNDGPIIVDTGFNIEAEQRDGKSSTSTTPTVNKPAAKRRITPIAIDP